MPSRVEVAFYKVFLIAYPKTLTRVRLLWGGGQRGQICPFDN